MHASLPASSARWPAVEREGLTVGMEAFDTVPMPHHCYLTEGRLLCWCHTVATDHVEFFKIGRERVSDEVGVALLSAECRQRNGRLLGPVVEPRRTVASMRTRGRRRR